MAAERMVVEISGAGGFVYGVRNLQLPARADARHTLS